MTELAHTTHVKEIERIIEHLNEDWINKNLRNFDQYFHNHVVMIEPGTNNKIVGSEQVIENYRDFVEDIEVSDFKITEMHVDLFDATAVAYFTYRMRYRVENTNYDESNAEILVFRRHDDHWQIVWRTQMLSRG